MIRDAVRHGAALHHRPDAGLARFARRRPPRRRARFGDGPVVEAVAGAWKGIGLPR
ncbi:hypothetical protein LN042_28090 [Kitasatospora sp. RB6PN24]|uniref:hypothetical protein n=1 Tax=Kitasatospora humi TaxID=2893891 RepID=UPI001E2C9BA9|nr:hypothetical protein [Kitasatospora humi]MCC9310885.1 hypothetical protein [Kitasatospora humi]